eukprot:88870-Amphidinium_carterae.2
MVGLRPATPVTPAHSEQSCVDISDTPRSRPPLSPRPPPSPACQTHSPSSARGTEQRILMPASAGQDGEEEAELASLERTRQLLPHSGRLSTVEGNMEPRRSLASRAAPQGAASREFQLLASMRATSQTPSCGSSRPPSSMALMAPRLSDLVATTSEPRGSIAGK